MKRQMPSEPVVPGMVLPLSSEEATLDRAGGKGANLASLARAGFEVPPGFIVTVDAYRGYVNASGIGPWVVGLAKAASPDDLDALESISNEIRERFAEGTVPAGMAETIQEAYTSLPGPAGGYPPVAVRSSATTEDLPGFSFEGLHETYLNIVGPDALEEAAIISPTR